MEKRFIKFMTCGKTVKIGEKQFVLIENANPAKNTVKAVAAENELRYQLLRSWCIKYENDPGFRDRFNQDIQNVKEEKETYVVEISLDRMEAIDQIRFIDPNYTTLFYVKNFGQIKIGDETYIVSYIDDYHFYLLDSDEKSAFVRGYHICQFAEICDRSHLTVEPVTEGGLQ